jgi:methylphosphotriester-DNA--protein-cysteine methyltransferase
MTASQCAVWPWAKESAQPMPAARLHWSSKSPLENTERWLAIVRRDVTAHFVYGVRTTGICCRPSCPARLARRTNIEFFDSFTAAETAGFRSCKRCRPHLSAVEDPRTPLVQKACESIVFAISSGQKPTLQKLATAAELSPCHFHRVFKKVTGLTPGQYISKTKNKGKALSNIITEQQHHEQREEWTGMKDNQPICSGVNVLGRQANDASLGVNAQPLSYIPTWNEFDSMLAQERDDFLMPHDALPDMENDMSPATDWRIDGDSSSTGVYFSLASSVVSTDLENWPQGVHDAFQLSTALHKGDRSTSVTSNPSPFW